MKPAKDLNYEPLKTPTELMGKHVASLQIELSLNTYLII